MGQSKRRDKPRCSKCKGEKGQPIPVSVTKGLHHHTVLLRCGCGYEYKSTSPTAHRHAIAYKLIPDYSGKILERTIVFSIRFNIKGDFKSMWEAEGWMHKNGYDSGSTGRGSDPVAITIGAYGLPQKWHNLSEEGRKAVDGIMFCGRNEPAIIYLFNLS